ncbi:putative cytochrome P450 [Medicago truncatula]|uniref:Cytochrome P450 family 71 protein n=1 Tax=Medicago truncatula TaxID=3880 RepID=A0A072V786_MEDTR|nr:cytochrome P450 71D11 [Medicago truncatula]KEH34025.1 cytochrome P450 family 71 protein [Medicago truncatula]RHN67352.1 putative cytochrome P450 [Medicago truncatula]
MALEVIYLSYLFSFVLLALVLQKVGKKLKKTDSTYNLPKGPIKLPIIGNLHNLLSSQPHQKLRDLARKYGPLMHLQLGQISMVVISSSDCAREVMKTHDINFAIRPPSLASVIISYNSTGIASASCGNYWRQLRKICTLELLSLKRVNSYQPIREEELSNLVKWIASKEGSPINLTQAVISIIYTIVSKAAFGKKFKDQDKFISAVKELVKVAAGFNLADFFPSITWLQYFTGLRRNLEREHLQIDQIMENIITEHKEAKSKGSYDQAETDQDLVDVLIKYEDGSNKEFFLTKDNIKAIILDIFGAGGETSASTIDWAMVEMVKDPRIMKKAQDEVREVFKMKGKVDENCINELNYLKLVVKETLRLHPPAPLLLPRECSQACDINGYHIPIKTKVIINAWAIARDSNYWTEPERFYPERFIESDIDYKGSNFEYIPFGAGRRICPGSIFGLRNIELALAMLLYHFDWKLPSGITGEEMDMTEEFGLTVRRKDDLLLCPFVYHPLQVT